MFSTGDTKCNLRNIICEPEVFDLVFSLGIYFFSLLVALISGKDEFTQVLSCTGTDFILSTQILEMYLSS